MLPQNEVKFRVTPERRQESQGRYAGMLRLRVPADGAYRVGTSRAAWVDLIEANGASLKPTKFEMQTQCDAVFKTVVFALRANETYTMQVSASREQNMPMFVVPHVER
jgi:hypothetical protein